MQFVRPYLCVYLFLFGLVCFGLFDKMMQSCILIILNWIMLLHVHFVHIYIRYILTFLPIKFVYL